MKASLRATGNKQGGVGVPCGHQNPKAPGTPTFTGPHAHSPSTLQKELPGTSGKQFFQAISQEIVRTKRNQLTSIKKKKIQPSKDQVGFLKASDEQVSGLQSGYTPRHKQQHSQKNPSSIYAYLLMKMRSEKISTLDEQHRGSWHTVLKSSALIA